MIAIKVLFCFCIISIDLSVSNGVDVLTTSGLVRGKSLNVLNKSINQFLNIPYAEPPLGELRFAKPKPLRNPIKGTIDGTKPGNSCIQNKEIQLVISPLGKNNLTFSEDCLVLNIWSPNDTSKLKPVMFWIHGGAYSLGSIFEILYNGSVLATYDVVIVSVNYRVGPLGFLYGGEETAPGNVGLFDQQLGLLWVRENIHLFGGDKNQITLFGESAGSWSVSAHIISPWSKGLFKRAIMQSGTLLFNRNRPPISKEEALNNAKQLAQNMKCPNNKQWLQCLRRVDAKQFIPLINKFIPLITFPIFETEFLPNYTQIALKEQHFNKDIDILAGANQDDGSVAMGLIPDLYNRTQNRQDFIDFVNTMNSIFFNIDIQKTTDFYLNNINESDPNAIRQKIIDFYGEFLFMCPTYLFTKRYVQHSGIKNNFFYHLTYAAYSNFLPGAYHTSDIPLAFGTALIDPSVTEKDKDFTRNGIKLWTDFAKYGKPNNWNIFVKPGINLKTVQYLTNINDLNPMFSIKCFINLLDNSSEVKYEKLNYWTKSLNSDDNSEMENLFYEIKDLNPKHSDKYLHHLFDKTCDGFWSQYY